MFMAAVMGNLTYAISLLVKSSDPAFLFGALPYLLGSAGTVFGALTKVMFDFVIFSQYLFYRDDKRLEPI
jgi:solute carrier family 66 (lysosomal lysine-arginine transporter), member 1